MSGYIWVLRVTLGHHARKGCRPKLTLGDLLESYARCCFFFLVLASRGGCLPLLLVLSGRVAMVASVPRGGCFAHVDGRGDCGALVVSVLRVGF